jgi:DNA ligase (NAD+)
MSIPNVGEETAEDLAKHFGTLNKIQNAKLEDLQKVEGVGEVVAQSVYGWFRQSGNKKLVADLLQHVTLNSKDYPWKDEKKGLLVGKTFVLTGTLPTLSRDEAKALIKQNGGDVSSSVSSQTDYVLAGEEAGSKLDKAEKLGVKIINESEFFLLLSPSDLK